MLGWESCDHTGPVVEGDRIRSECTVLEILHTQHGAVLKLHAQSHVTGEGQDDERPVLDWKFWVLGL
jgi:acyl dehydratase